MLELFLIITILLFSVIVHEYAHGLVALLLGDDTAKKAGRLSFNIMRHIDIVGTVIVPLFLLTFYLMTGSGILFGWAKPVPIRVDNLRNPAKDYTYVSIAGSLSNIILSLVFAFILPFLMMVFDKQGTAFSIGRFICFFGVKINIILAIFNLLPIPPLDGSHILAYLLPYNLSIRYLKIARYGILIIIFLIFTDALKYLFLFSDFLSNLLLRWMDVLGNLYGVIS
ncbi:MAG TPA: site-2 protease family protein [Desulfatiglandales bacterium]|nr:site-2 protease family protein [Desulfatiglandales bacterium]